MKANWPIIAVSAAVALTVPVVVRDGYIVQLLNIAILNAIVVLGLNFATGWTGQINFGQAAFYGLGAYTTAIVSKAGLPWIATPFLSVIVVIAASLMLGLPTMRLRTYYLAMTTIGFGEIIRLMSMLIVGGRGSIDGCVVGAAALTILPEALRFLGQWYLVLYGLGVIAVIVLAPGGLASLASQLALRLARAR